MGAGYAVLEHPWRVRIRGADGSVLGAGMVLCTGHVLTCAHVVARTPAPDSGARAPGPEPPPLAKFTIEFCGMLSVPPVGARAVQSGWFPPLADGRGDVALLQLDRTQPDGSAAPMRRVPPSPHRAVRMFGFPADVETGEWVGATVMGDGGPGGEWVQMNGTPDMRVRHGFSGAGVVDDTTQSVIGMVVTAHTSPTRAVSWMLPIETIVRYAPQVDACVHGGSAVDRSLTTGVGAEPADPELARHLARWLGRRGAGAVLIIVTGDRDSAPAATLRRALVLGDRGLRPASTVHSSEETVPPVGSVDLAIDAADKTVEEVSRRIVDRLGIQGDEFLSASDRILHEAPSMTLVVDAVDDAREPAALMAEVLEPLAASAAERDIRLLIGFRRESSPGLRVLVRQRLNRLAALVEAVGRAEEAARRTRASTAARIADTPEAPDHWSSLRLRLTALRGLEAGGQLLPASLEAHESAAERALGRAEAVGRGLEELVARHRELRGHLDAYRAAAAGDGLAEDVELGALLRRADRSLRQRPCDLPAAAELVERYVQALQSRRDPQAEGRSL